MVLAALYKVRMQSDTALNFNLTSMGAGKLCFVLRIMEFSCSVTASALKTSPFGVPNCVSLPLLLV